MNILRNRKEKGFTIIEVVLVLAIAALIFAMVFIALPALQRSQRDTQRKADMARLQTALTSYTSNNSGALPSSTTGWNNFITTYLTSGGKDTFVDPLGSTSTQASSTTYVLTPITAGTEVSSTFVQNVIYYATNATCNSSNAATTQTAGSRSVAFQMTLEGGGVACLNN
jgi:prepilin-type N-terminal cleavage/methylation domain-containing protein